MQRRRLLTQRERVKDELDPFELMAAQQAKEIAARVEREKKEAEREENESWLIRAGVIRSLRSNEWSKPLGKRN